MTYYAPVSYWYPDLGVVDSRWQSVLDTQPPFALVNPNSGPGTSTDPTYVDLCALLGASGIRTVGYVSTLWGERSEATILSEIDAYHDWYGVEGVFFDECPNFWSPNQQGHIDKYTSLRDEIRSTYGSDFFIVHNPGTVPIEAMIPLADLHMSFESYATNYLTNPDYFPSWLQDHAAKMWHVVYGVTEDNAQAVMDKVGQWASHVYLTDRGHDPEQVDDNNAPSTPENNPYLTPPAPWLLTLQQGQNGDTMRLIPGPILGYLGAKVDVVRHQVDAAASVNRATLDHFEVPEGKTLLLTAVGTHSGNPWQTPSLQAGGVSSFPNFDVSNVAAGVEWTHGSVHTGPATVTLTVGNTSPWEDEANLSRFTGTVAALTVPSDQIPTISGGN